MLDEKILTKVLTVKNELLEVFYKFYGDKNNQTDDHVVIVGSALSIFVAEIVSAIFNDKAMLKHKYKFMEDILKVAKEAMMLAENKTDKVKQ